MLRRSDQACPVSMSTINANEQVTNRTGRTAVRECAPETLRRHRACGFLAYGGAGSARARRNPFRQRRLKDGGEPGPRLRAGALAGPGVPGDPSATCSPDGTGFRKVVGL